MNGGLGRDNSWINDFPERVPKYQQVYWEESGLEARRAEIEAMPYGEQLSVLARSWEEHGLSSLDLLRMIKECDETATQDKPEWDVYECFRRKLRPIFHVPSPQKGALIAASFGFGVFFGLGWLLRRM